MTTSDGLRIDPESVRAFGDRLWTELENTLQPMITEVTDGMAQGHDTALGSSGHDYSGPRLTSNHGSSAEALTPWLADLRTGIESLAIGAVVSSQMLQDCDTDTSEGLQEVARINNLVNGYSNDNDRRSDRKRPQCPPLATGRLARRLGHDSRAGCHSRHPRHMTCLP